MLSHAILLAAQAAFCGGILLALFHQRRRFGLGPLYLVLGTLQFAQFVLAVSIRVQIAPGFLISPATAVLFPLTVIVVLLTYVEDDAEATRSLAYGIVICNLTLYAVTTMTGQHLRFPGHDNVLGLSPESVQQPGRIILASSVAIVADLIGAIMLFEALSRRVTSSLFLRLWTTAALVMVLDSVLFTTLAFAPRRAYWSVLASGLVAKIAGATFYAALTAWYVRTFEQPQPAAGGAAGRGDVFAWLTYRQRYEEARTLMARDALTGLYNRGYFDEMAPRQLAHADRARHQMSLVLVDIDRLKIANDQFGHEAGDDLVRAVATEIAQMVRTSDAACRYGGDEFVVILTNADAAAARIFAERLVHNVQAHTVAAAPRAPWAPASVSIGLATYPADGTTLRDLLRTADGRLYESKRGGGGRVTGAI
jgi:diguanylate cyclase (GGDEF)-like protein